MLKRDFRLARRELLRSALLGTAGIGAYGFLRELGLSGALKALPGAQLLHAADVLADALNFGPSLFHVSQALAQSASNPAVYRVFYETSHDIRNELCLVSHGEQYNPFRSLNYAAAATQLQTMIQAAPAPHSILNAWAHKLLTTGKIEGTTALAAGIDAAPLTPDEIQRISVVAAVGMTGSQGVHQMAAIPRVGTLEYAMLQAYSGYSPIGTVTIGNRIIDAAGGVNSPGTSVGDFIGSIDVPATYMSRAQGDDNPVRVLDGMTGDKGVKQVRDQMLDAHNLLISQLQNIQRYVGLSGQTFAAYGQRRLEGLAAMMMFADLFKQGLATIGSVGLKSFDFHATDAMRAPNANSGNMLTESAQALAGTFYIARAAFDAKRDAIVHFTTCSNRSENWVADDSHVSTVTFIIKGTDTSPFSPVPPQVALLPDNIGATYAEGPGNGTATYSGADAQAVDLTGTLTVGRLEATLVRAAGKALGREPAHALEDPPGKLI
jgi:hypothetical protein